MSAGLRSGFARGRDGTPLHFTVEGPENGPAVVLSDGIGCDGYVWKYLTPVIGKSHRVVHWHYRGHGQTPAPRDPRRIDIVDLADDLDAVAEEALGDRPAVLCGHSMGVQVSLETFRRHPDRVRALALLCGSYGFPLRTFKGKRTLEQVVPYLKFLVHRIPRVATAVNQIMLPTDLAFQIATRFELNGELIKREDFFPYLVHMARVDMRLFLEMLAAAGRHSARELLEQIDVPTLIVAGDRDGFTPPALSQEMHDKIAGSQLFVVTGGSHTAPIERPDEVNAEIERFLRRLEEHAPEVDA